MLKQIQRIDNMISEKITHVHRPLFNRIMVFMTYAGTAAIIWWVTLCIPFLITKKYRVVGINLALSLGVTYVLGEIIIKKLTGRSRPSEKIGDDEMMINKPKDYSFPSGHTASSFTAAIVVIMWQCPIYIWLPSLIAASLIGFSRIYLRVHYLTDVIAGAALGVISGAVTTILFRHIFAV